MDKCQSEGKLLTNFQAYWSIQIFSEKQGTKWLVHTDFPWNSYGPMAPKSLWKFWSTPASVHRVPFPGKPDKPNWGICRFLGRLSLPRSNNKSSKQQSPRPNNKQSEHTKIHVRTETQRGIFLSVLELRLFLAACPSHVLLLVMDGGNLLFGFCSRSVIRVPAVLGVMWSFSWCPAVAAVAMNAPVAVSSFSLSSFSGFFVAIVYSASVLEVVMELLWSLWLAVVVFGKCLYCCAVCFTLRSPLFLLFLLICDPRGSGLDVEGCAGNVFLWVVFSCQNGQKQQWLSDECSSELWPFKNAHTILGFGKLRWFGPGVGVLASQQKPLQNIVWGMCREENWGQDWVRYQGQYRRRPVPHLLQRSRRGTRQSLFGGRRASVSSLKN